MKKLKAVFLDKASVSPADIDFSTLESTADWHWLDNASVDEVINSLVDAEIVVTNKITLNSELLAMAEKLKLICVAATGVNNVDLQAANSLGIAVCNVNSYATASVTQHVFSLLLSLNRQLRPYQQAVADGSWSQSDFFCYFGETFSDLQGKIIGIIGHGELGQSVATVAKCFGMKVLIAKRDGDDKREDRVELDSLLMHSDVVSLHCPLTAQNRHMIGADELALMKSDAILINTARGGLIDEAALLDALKNKEIGAAALDVLEQEPPAIDHPLINYGADNLIITPHIAWASRESRQRLVDELAKNIVAFQKGEPRNVV